MVPNKRMTRIRSRSCLGALRKGPLCQILIHFYPTRPSGLPFLDPPRPDPGSPPLLPPGAAGSARPSSKPPPPRSASAAVASRRPVRILPPRRRAFTPGGAGSARPSAASPRPSRPTRSPLRALRLAVPEDRAHRRLRRFHRPPLRIQTNQYGTTMVLDSLSSPHRRSQNTFFVPSAKKPQTSRDDSWSALVERHQFLLTTLVVLAFLCTIYLYFAVTLGASNACAGLAGAERIECQAKSVLRQGKLKFP